MRLLFAVLLGVIVAALPAAEAFAWLELTGPGALKTVLLGVSILACPVLMGVCDAERLPAGGPRGDRAGDDRLAEGRGP